METVLVRIPDAAEKQSEVSAELYCFRREISHRYVCAFFLKEGKDGVG